MHEVGEGGIWDREKELFNISAYVSALSIGLSFQALERLAGITGQMGELWNQSLHINRKKNFIWEIRCLQIFGKVREAGSRLGLQK